MQKRSINFESEVIIVNPNKFKSLQIMHHTIHLRNVLEKVYEAFIKKTKSLAFHPEFTKPFETAYHEILYQKLEYHSL